MDSPQRSERIEGIRRTLETRDTEDLLEIWQANDRVEWTPEAFEAIQRILLARNVSLPAQNTEVEETNQETVVDAPGVLAEEEADTYYDRHRLDRISAIARALSWFAIVLLCFFLILEVINTFQSLSSFGSLPVTLFSILVNLAIPILVFGFIWVVLQLIAEGIYLFIDIEENTCKGAGS